MSLRRQRRFRPFWTRRSRGPPSLAAVLFAQSAAIQPHQHRRLLVAIHCSTDTGLRACRTGQRRSFSSRPPGCSCRALAAQLVVQVALCNLRSPSRHPPPACWDLDIPRSRQLLCPDHSSLEATAGGV